MKKAYTRKLKGKRFSVAGAGVQARAWKVEGEPSKGKGKIFRRERPERRLRPPYGAQATRQRFLVQRIAFELFPENAIKVTGLDERKGVIRSVEAKPDKALRALLESEAERKGLMRKSRRAGGLSQKENERLVGLIEGDDVLRKRVRERMDDPQVKETVKALESAGLVVDDNPFNLTYRKGKPVFYEFSFLHPAMVRAFLEKNAGRYPPKKIKRVRGLLLEIEAAGRTH